MAVVSVSGDLTPDLLRDQLTEGLASFAIPSRWQIVDSPLPVNHSGKIDKPAIAAAARASIESEQMSTMGPRRHDRPRDDRQGIVDSGR
jgi:non-ribosomal peptide synthetase component E (peptide arylation enzyme)